MENETNAEYSPSIANDATEFHMAVVNGKFYYKFEHHI